MKLLHTGDLHLGKSLHETSLLEDQSWMLDRLADALAQDTYAALIIAGDVYDRAVPGADAVQLFSGFLIRLRRDFPALDICIIPGNHDSAQRLSFADEILGERHIHIICNPANSFTPIMLSRGGEEAALFLLPFLAPGTLETRAEPEPRRAMTTDRAESASGAPALPEFDFDAPEETDSRGLQGERERPILSSQADLAAEAARRFDEVLSRPEYGRTPAILAAHLFTLAGRQSESERIFLGTAEQVPPALFSRFSYVALGHLHRSQRVTPRMYYAGSPLAYAFDEAGSEKSFLKVEIDCAAPGFPVTVTPVPFAPFRKVTRLSGPFSDFFSGSRYDAYAADYLEITLTDSDLVVNPMNLLRPKFPWLLSLKQGTVGVEAGDVGEPDAQPDAETRDPAADFCRFEEMLYGTVDPEKRDLFNALLAECSDEA